MKNLSFMTENELTVCRKAFQGISFHFAAKMVELNGSSSANRELFLVSLLLSYSLSVHGHICLNLESPDKLNSLLSEAFSDSEEKSEPPLFSNNDIIAKLQSCRIIGRAGDYLPMILDEKLLYLHKYWVFERKIADKLRYFGTAAGKECDMSLLKDGLNRIFPISKLPENSFDFQRLAAFSAVVNRFCVITGGPGTGKTTVTAAVLLLLQEQAFKNKGQALRICLCAPTGKAAARLSEAISEEKRKMKFSDSVIKDAVPENSITLHKLLGSIYLSPNFRHNADKPIDADVIVVDEASMVPAALMARLFDAVRQDASLILLGDRDQLSSVEAGAVFTDICDADMGENLAHNLFSQDFAELYRETLPEAELKITCTPTVLNNNVVELIRSHRFSPDKGIGKLKEAVNSGNSILALETAKNDPSGEIVFNALPKSSFDFLKNLTDFICELKVNNESELFLSYLDSSDIDTAIRLFNRFKILCANKTGPWGTIEVNSLLTKIVRNRKKIIANEIYFKGLPILITQNCPSLGLYNGDVGLCWTSELNPEGIGVFFPNASKPGLYSSFSPAQLPEHDTVFAMTIHKSQGSGFEKVLMILSGKEDSPILSRELVYTGITRAKKNAVIWSSEQAFENAVCKRTLRSSGLVKNLL
ncbi:MAG TPA: exodeoxyribonuclease V subunit alpha [Lentisphaeria bacterium]|nr:exodeoxyribonuclease V subunit alpha [Lentisphaeria bacterium]